METMLCGNWAPSDPPTNEYPEVVMLPFTSNVVGMLCCAGFKTSGGEPSNAVATASLPFVCSKNIPYPPRIAVLPSPKGSQAKPMRGAGLNRCPFAQPVGTPAAPHCTRPLAVSPATVPSPLRVVAPRTYL